ncbi:MAG: glycosyltransferase [Verrucomicrobiota bacterium]
MSEFEVIIPVRNGGRILGSSIDSILSGSSSADVLLTVSDNFSTDGSPWREDLKKHPASRWRVISPPSALGRVEHWSWAFAQGQSRWIKPLMAGDRVEAEFWEWVSGEIVRQPGAGLFFCEAYYIDPARAHPEDAGRAAGGPAMVSFYDHAAFQRDAARVLNRVGALSQILVRQDVLKSALPFDPKFPWTADWGFYGRCLEKAPGVRTTARLACQDRSIARLSTSWKGLRGSFGEEWRFAREQAAKGGVPAIAALFLRLRAMIPGMIFKIGRLLLPRSVRKSLTRAAGLHRPSAAPGQT